MKGAIIALITCFVLQFVLAGCFQAVMPNRLDIGYIQTVEKIKVRDEDTIAIRLSLDAAREPQKPGFCIGSFLRAVLSAKYNSSAAGK